MNRRQMVTSLLALTGVGALGQRVLGEEIFTKITFTPPKPTGKTVSLSQAGRRVYYIDIGDLPQERAIQYVEQFMADYRRV